MMTSWKAARSHQARVREAKQGRNELKTFSPSTSPLGERFKYIKLTMTKDIAEGVTSLALSTGYLSSGQEEKSVGWRGEVKTTLINFSLLSCVLS